jgi:NAD(P)H-nitrite reductase large subunit
MVEENGGAARKFAVRLAEALASEDEALKLVQRTISWFRNKERPCRIVKILEEIDLEGLRAEII